VRAARRDQQRAAGTPGVVRPAPSRGKPAAVVAAAGATGTSEPTPNEPLTNEPGVAEPGNTEPGNTEPGNTEPGNTEPAGASEPGSSDDPGADPGASGQPAPAAEPASSGDPGASPEPDAEPTDAGAAAELIGMLTRPEVSRALLATLSGSVGATRIGVGGRGVPTTHVLDMLSELAFRASAHQNARGLATEESVPRYLLDDDGSFVCDPASSSERADALFELLSSTVPRGARGAGGLGRFRSADHGLFEMLDRMEDD